VLGFIITLLKSGGDMGKNAVRSLVVLMAVIALATGTAHAAGWAWKMSTTPDDVMNFLNGKPPYSGGAKDVVKVTAASKGSYLEFIVFYQSGGTDGWGWKKATTSNDAMNFLNGTPPYKPLRAAEVASVSTPSGTRFYIFYKLK
jgi:hypothetical protein